MDYNEETHDEEQVEKAEEVLEEYVSDDDC